jgi:hypothetical protein
MAKPWAERASATPDEEVGIAVLAHREAIKAFRSSIGKIDFDKVSSEVGVRRLSTAIALAVKAHDKTYSKALKAIVSGGKTLFPPETPVVNGQNGAEINSPTPTNV